jgi:hypothetical protein
MTHQWAETKRQRGGSVKKKVEAPSVPKCGLDIGVFGANVMLIFTRQIDFFQVTPDVAKSIAAKLIACANLLDRSKL